MQRLFDMFAQVSYSISNTMRKKHLYLLLIIAIVVSGTLSYIFYNNIQTNRTRLRSQQSKNTSQNVSPTIPRPTSPFGIPRRGSDQKVVTSFWEEIQSKATKTTTINVTDCKPNPQITLLTLAKTFTITNSDEIPKIITVLDNRSYVVPAKGKVEMIADFEKGPGMFEYRCNNSPKPVGVLVVVGPG